MLILSNSPISFSKQYRKSNVFLVLRLVTLTPISEDDSRHDIPDNLKLFFRPVAMTMPDVEVVAEVLLHSMGFTKVCSKRKTSLNYDSNVIRRVLKG